MRSPYHSLLHRYIAGDAFLRASHIHISTSIDFTFIVHGAVHANCRMAEPEQDDNETIK